MSADVTWLLSAASVPFAVLLITVAPTLVENTRLWWKVRHRKPSIPAGQTLSVLNAEVQPPREASTKGSVALVYMPRDPLIVHATVLYNDIAMTYPLSRDLLLTALAQPDMGRTRRLVRTMRRKNALRAAGECSVRIRCTGDRLLVFIDLDVEGTRTLRLSVSARRARRAAKKWTDMVPVGAEQVDVDGAVQRLLARQG